MRGARRALSRRGSGPWWEEIQGTLPVVVARGLDTWCNPAGNPFFVEELLASRFARIRRDTPGTAQRPRADPLSRALPWGSVGRSMPCCHRANDGGPRLCCTRPPAWRSRRCRPTFAKPSKPTSWRSRPARPDSASGTRSVRSGRAAGAARGRAGRSFMGMSASALTQSATECSNAELAIHWRAAGQVEHAFVASVRAGLDAEHAHAASEAFGHFEQALSLRGQLPVTPEGGRPCGGRATDPRGVCRAILRQPRARC